MAVARAIFNLYASAFMQSANIFSYRTLGNAKSVCERKDGDESRRFALEVRMP